MFFHAITICKILFGSDTLNEENYKPSSTKDTILRAISQVNQAQFKCWWQFQLLIRITNKKLDFLSPGFVIYLILQTTKRKTLLLKLAEYVNIAAKVGQPQ